MKRVLLVEDEPSMRLGLKDNLELEGYEVLMAVDGRDGLDQTIRTRPDLVILDLMLPRMDGLEVCRTLRSRGLGMPILMLTARAQQTDTVLGLELGADDYVTKPFNIRELLARVKALLRRAEGSVTDVYQFGDVVVDFRRQSALKAGQPLSLSSLEFSVLRYLVGRRGEVVSRDELLNDVWGYKAFPTTRSVDNLMLRLRQKLEAEPREPRHILTVHGTGYRFVE
jgi:DNA-binding response OmpR family regulator